MSAGLRITASELISSILETSRSFFWKRPEFSFGNFKKSPLETRKEWTQKHTLDFGEN